MARTDESKDDPADVNRRSPAEGGGAAAGGAAVTIPLPDRGPQPLSLRRNFVWNFAGSLVYAACQWGMLVVLAKLGTPIMVGRFVLGLAVSAPVFMFFSLKLRSIQATDSRQEYQFGEYLGLRLLTNVMALGSVVCIIYVAYTLGYPGETLLVIFLVGLAKALESISETFYGLLQQKERLDRIAKSTFAHGLLGFAALGIGVYVTGRIAWGVGGLVLSRLVVMLCYDIPGGVWVLRSCTTASAASLAARLVSLRPSWNLSQLRSLAWLGLPLAGTRLLASLNTNCPRYFIAHDLGEYQLGIFGAIAALMTAGATISQALNHASCMRLSQHYADGRTAAFRSLFFKLVLLYVVLGIAGLAVVSVAGRTILTLLFRPEYANHQDVLLYVMMALAVAYLASSMDIAMISVRRIGTLFPLMCLTSLTTVVGCWLLVPRHGLAGAALALAVAKIPMVVVGMVLLLRYTRPEPQLVETGSKLPSDSNVISRERSTRCAG